MSFEKTAVPHPDDTIVAVSSAAGPAERAVVRLSGPATRAVVEAVFRPEGRIAPRRVVPGSLALRGVHSPVPAVLYFFPAPRSYTGQAVAEIHTIGSPPLVERLVSDLLDAGARPARPGEFTLRAFLAGKKDLPRAEAVQALIEADNDADLRTALVQLAGGLSRPLEALRDDLLDLLADIEAALDFADEDIEFVGRSEIRHRLDTGLSHLAGLIRQLDTRAVSGRPVRVALVGAPNAGKSSLFNALAGADALVSPLPGTTRDYLTVRLELGGVPVELTDTPGWEEASDTIAEQAQSLGREQAHRADLLLWCDPSGDFTAADASRLTATGAVVIRVRTKADLAGAMMLPSSQVAKVDGLSSSVGPSIVSCSVVAPGGTDGLRAALTDSVVSLARPAPAPGQSRCRHHLVACAEHLTAARAHVERYDPPELVASALRAALDQLGELTGAVYTNDLLDRIFSRFCIGK